MAGGMATPAETLATLTQINSVLGTAGKCLAQMPLLGPINDEQLAHLLVVAGIVGGLRKLFTAEIGRVAEDVPMASVRES